MHDREVAPFTFQSSPKLNSIIFKSLKCDLCPFITYRNSKLKQHVDRAHNKMRPKKALKCPKCPRSFWERRPYNKHLLDEHDMLPKK